MKRAVVFRPVFPVDVIGDYDEGREAVEPRAALVAGAHEVAQLPVDLYPRHQVFDARRGRVKRLTGSLMRGDCVTTRSRYSSMPAIS